MLQQSTYSPYKQTMPHRRFRFQRKSIIKQANLQQFQQEVQNISANVKKGLDMKMQRGELVGFNGCLGYNYDIEKKTLTVNPEEAVVVKYIFKRYIDGLGTHMIAKELMKLGYKTKKGNTRWSSSTVGDILKNVKYKGDLVLGKTY
ncbi:MAG: recombinase family protein, partial [Candidatus Riflebacteria bacterium]|nr:recombinase family protein [Candidatus Riflebacteria bacterium]